MREIPEFESQRLRFRAPSMDDLDDEIAFFATERARGVGGPLPKEQVWRSLCGVIGHWCVRGYGFWGVEEKATGRYVGRVGPWSPMGWPEPEIGWTVMEWAEGTGMAHEAAIAARAYMYEHYGWTTAISLIAHFNYRSQTLAQRLGCVREDDYTHPSFGPCMVWRHPGPEAL